MPCDKKNKTFEKKMSRQVVDKQKKNWESAE
jgi:hypothetical protein